LTRVKSPGRVAVVEDTRTRILERAWDLVLDQGVADLTLAAVGRAAGVSRQAVYLHFANRAGLLREMARHVDHASGFVDRVRGTRELPAPQRLERLLREWLAYLPRILPVARALEAAAVTGDDGADAFRERMGEWRDAIRRAVAALDRTEALDPDWTVDEAADWIWAAVHPATYHHLVVDRGWAPERVAERTVATLLRQVVVGAR
jgi:AcrR family transcriptional regulator